MEQNDGVFGAYTKWLVVDTEQGKFVIDPQDQVIGLALRNKGQWARQELKQILSLIDPSTDVLIIGAHIGTLLVPIAKAANKVVGIEANPRTHNILEMNIQINNIKNCEIYNVAASDKEEKLPFLMNTTNSGGSKRMPVVQNEMYTLDHPIEIVVDAMPLDLLLSGQSFDMIIMDIEGSEYFALKGMEKLLQHAGVLIFEFVPHHLKNVANITIKEFVRLLEPFDIIIWPTRNVKVNSENFFHLLTFLYENEVSEDGLIAFKHRSQSGNCVNTEFSSS